MPNQLMHTSQTSKQKRTVIAVSLVGGEGTPELVAPDDPDRVTRLHTFAQCQVTTGQLLVLGLRGCAQVLPTE